MPQKSSLMVQERPVVKKICIYMNYIVLKFDIRFLKQHTNAIIE
jgi:hypothetical protein